MGKKVSAAPRRSSSKALSPGRARAAKTSKQGSGRSAAKARPRTASSVGTAQAARGAKLATKVTMRLGLGKPKKPGSGPAAPRPASATGAVARGTDRAAAKSQKLKKDKALASEVEQFLRSRLAELDSRIREKLEEHMSLRESRSGDPTDVASDAIDDEMALQVAEVETRERIQIREAFERVAAGTYGFCERCGERIPVARLKALPSASMCVKCKELEEEFGPAVFEPGGGRADDDDEDADADSESS